MVFIESSTRDVAGVMVSVGVKPFRETLLGNDSSDLD